MIYLKEFNFPTEDDAKKVMDNIGKTQQLIHHFY